MYITFAK